VDDDGAADEEGSRAGDAGHPDGLPLDPLACGVALVVRVA
jgi:hypothetical protein